ncbi:MAG: flagellar filament capping protein FliD [Planctomycetales bacterium]|nr:flagellar filament capping protein FliD [bacterium]UNM07747.1 MAG: flagellar filament capping protein FliD [Planctomycetales bacterium]
MSIQFSGLASGTDWNSVIDQLVSLERRSVETLQNQRSDILFKQSALSDVNKQLQSLDRVFSTLRFESTWLSRSTNSSDPARVSGIAQSGASLGTYNVEVNRLATPSRATSGLDDTLYTKVANLSQTQNIGIASLTPFSDFQPTRALSTTLIKNTLQAGQAGARITAGDTISINGNLKDGSAVSGTFTFNGDETDTLGRLAITVAQVFHGEIAGSIGSNGELTFIETNPSVAGDVTFNTLVTPIDLTFNDTDYSGSTLDFGIGNNVAGAAATTRRLVGTQVFTSAGVLELSDATDLASLDQVTSGTLNNGDKIRITGKNGGGSTITPVDFTYTGAAGGQTIADLVSAISGAYAGATASYENGRIVLTSDTPGANAIELNLSFVDTLGATSMSLGSFSVAETGRDNGAQMITTGSFTVEGTGSHLLSNTDGKAGRIRGNVSILDPSNTLSSYGITDFDLFTIDVDNASGGIDPVTIKGLSEYSTLQDFVDAVNKQVPAVTAQLIDVGGSFRLEIVANQGGRDIRLYDTAGGIMDRLIQIGATDLDSSSNDLSITFGSTTATNDYTMVDWFTPDNGGPMQRRVITGDEGGPVLDLIGGVALNDGGGGFNPGVATVRTGNSSELNTQVASSTYIFGSRNIGVNPPTKIPFIDPTVTLAQAGFAITPENADTNPLFHTNGFFTINGVAINIGDVNSTTINDVLGKINSSGAGVTAYFDSANSRFYLKNNSTGSAGISLGGNGDTSNFLTIAGLTQAAGGISIQGRSKGTVDTGLPLAQSGMSQQVSSGVFTINGVRITVDAGVDSLTDLMNKINNSGAGVKASYDPTADKLTLTQVLNEDVTSVQISLGDPSDTSNFLEAANLTLDTTAVSQVGSIRLTSSFSVNGINYIRKSNEVSDVVDKVALNLNGVTTGPVSISVEQDNDRMSSAILDFIVEWNTTMERINTKPLSKEEKKGVKALTDEDAQGMTIQEIDEYLNNRQSLMLRDFTANDSSVRQISRRMQNLVMGVVNNDGSFGSLSAIGISTAEIGAGAEAATVSQSRLLAPTSDREQLKLLMESNAELQDAIANHSEDLYELFAAALQSLVQVTGSKNLSGGITVSQQLQFEISNGKGAATVNFTPGSYSQNQVLNRINQALSTAGLQGSMLAYYDSQSQLNIRSASTTEAAQLRLRELSPGADSILTAFGWTAGTLLGEDPDISGGIAMRSRSYIDGITGVGGIVFERIKQNGSFDRQVSGLDDAIEQAQLHVSNYETRLRNKFSRLEVNLSQLQSQQQALEGQITALNAATNGNKK